MRRVSPIHSSVSRERSRTNVPASRDVRGQARDRPAQLALSTPAFATSGPIVYKESTMPRTFLSDVKPGDAVEDIFVISTKQLSTTSTGKPFIKCFISDRTRQISARMWNASQAIFNAMPEGGFLRVAGRVENYQDNLQFIIDRFWIVDDPAEIKLDELMPTTKKNVGEMFDKVTSLLKSIRNSSLRALVDAFLDDAGLVERFKKAPAAMSFHHAYVGGLLEHTLNAMEVSQAVCAFYPLLNRDMVVAGIFLHDIAKTWELTYESSFGYSDGGQLIGHIVKAAIWVEDKARVASRKMGKPIDNAVVEHMQHIILSHHGTPEFGAAKLPMSPEAIAVHMIENMDAKLTMALLATRDPSTPGDGSFTDFQKALGVRLYRPDVAKPDA
jgi:3'-5' exoribonuclease